jgi:hypothetical protein
MKTKQIIETLRDYKHGILDEYLSKSDINAGIAIDAAIERLQFLENKNRKLINNIIRLMQERDEARKFAQKERLHGFEISNCKSGWVNFPWEKRGK